MIGNLEKTKKTIAALVMISLVLQMAPNLRPAQAFSFQGIVNKIFTKIQLPNELEITETGGLLFGTATKNYLSAFDCFFKEVPVVSASGKPGTDLQFCGCDLKAMKCGWRDNPKCQDCVPSTADCGKEPGKTPCCLKGNERCVSPFSTFALNALSSQSALFKNGQMTLPRPKPPEQCQLKIPMPEDDFTLDVSEKAAQKTACNYVVRLQEAAAQQVYLAKKMYNSTDPLNDCFFLRNCKTECTLRLGEVRYDISVLDILKLIVPGGFLGYIQQIMSVVSAVQKVAKIVLMVEDVLKTGVGVFNTILGIVNNVSTLASVWENLGLKWKDVISAMTGPVGLYANKDRLKKGYNGFVNLINNFSTNMIEYSQAKSEALVLVEQTKKDIKMIVEGDGKAPGSQGARRGFKNEPEVGFLFAVDQTYKDNWQKKNDLAGIISDFQASFTSFRGLVNGLAAIGQVVGKQSAADRKRLTDFGDWDTINPSQGYVQAFKSYCTCQNDGACGKLWSNWGYDQNGKYLSEKGYDGSKFDLDIYWLNHQGESFLSGALVWIKNRGALNKDELNNCQACWDNYALCANEYFPEGFLPADNKERVACLQLPAKPPYDFSKSFDENVTLEQVAEAYKNFQETNGQGCPINYAPLPYQREPYFCYITDTERYIPRAANYTIDNRGAYLTDPDYIRGVIERSMPKEGGSGYGVMSSDKGAWRVYWQNLAEFCQSKKWVQSIINDNLLMSTKHTATIQACERFPSADNPFLTQYSGLDPNYAGDKRWDFVCQQRHILSLDGKTINATVIEKSIKNYKNCIDDNYTADGSKPSDGPLNFGREQGYGEWFSTFRETFTDINAFNDIMNGLNPDDIVKRIKTALNYEKEYISEDGEVGPVEVYHYKLLDEHKGAWEYLWQKIARAIKGEVWFYDMMEKTDMQARHLTMVETAIEALPVLKFFAAFDNTVRDKIDIKFGLKALGLPNFDFQDSDYQGEDNIKKCDKDICPLTLSFVVDDGGRVINAIVGKNNEFKCGKILPKHIQACADYFKNQTQEKMIYSSSFIARTSLEIIGHITALGQQKTELAGKTPEYPKKGQNRYWESANFCAASANGCSGSEYTKQFKDSYKAELAELPDWDERIDSLEGAKSVIQMLKTAALDYNLAPDQSVLVYHLVNAQKILAGLKNDFAKTLNDLISQLKCGAGGIDCQGVCYDWEGKCLDTCDGRAKQNIRAACYDGCRDFPTKDNYSDQARAACKAFCDAHCKEAAACDKTNSYICNNSCGAGFQKCKTECSKAGAGGSCAEKTALENLKKQLDEFFKSKDGYQSLNTNLGLTKDIVRALLDIWQKPMSAASEAEIAREYVERILNTILYSRGLYKELEEDEYGVSGKKGVQFNAPMTQIEKGLAPLKKAVNLLEEIIDGKGAYSGLKFSNSAQSALRDIYSKLKEPLDDIENQVIIPIKRDVGEEYKCQDNKSQTGFLYRIACFEDKNGRTFKQLLKFIDVVSRLLDAQYKMDEVAEAISVLEPQLRMEFGQVSPEEAVAMLEDETLGKFKFWEKKGDKISLDGIVIDGFDKFKQAVSQNPIIFLQGAYKAINNHLTQLMVDYVRFYKKDNTGEVVAIVPQKENDKDIPFNPFRVFGIDNIGERKENGVLLETQDIIGDGDVFGAGKDKDRKEAYKQAVENLRTGNLFDLGRKVFGDKNLDTACRLLSPILNDDPRELTKKCQEPRPLLAKTNENEKLGEKCTLLLRSDLSVLDLSEAEVQAEIAVKNLQRSQEGSLVSGIACPDKCPSADWLKKSKTTCANALGCEISGDYLAAAKCFTCPKPNPTVNKNLDGAHLGNGDWCWPPVDANGAAVEGSLARAQFCKTTASEIKVLGGEGIADLCWLIEGGPLACDAAAIKDANQKAKIIQAMNDAINDLDPECTELQVQKDLQAECEYLVRLKKGVFDDNCSHQPNCTEAENQAYQSGGTPTLCRQQCQKAIFSAEATFCLALTGDTSCALPDLTLQEQKFQEVDFDCLIPEQEMATDLERDFCFLQEQRDRAWEICALGASNIKTPLDEVMKIFSILLGIKSGTGLYNGVSTLLTDVKKISSQIKKLVSAIKGDGTDYSGVIGEIQKAWDDAAGKEGEKDKGGGLKIKPLACNTHPAESYSELRGSKATGPMGGPVCPDITDYFNQLEAQFGIVRQNLQQIDLARKKINQEYLAIPFTKLNFHLFDKREVVYHSIDPLYDLADGLKQKAQFVWALSTAVNFASQNCTCGKSYCKLPLCISGLPLAFGPVSNPSCYLAWIFRYPLVKLAESLEKDLQGIQ